MKILKIFVSLVVIILVIVAIFLWFPSSFQIKLPTMFDKSNEPFSFSDTPLLFPYYEWREVPVSEQQLAKSAIVVAYHNIEDTAMELPGHEWVSVKMADKGVKPLMDQPVTLFGTLHVGEMRENGFLVGIYRMDGERLGEPVGN